MISLNFGKGWTNLCGIAGREVYVGWDTVHGIDILGGWGSESKFRRFCGFSKSKIVRISVLVPDLTFQNLYKTLLRSENFILGWEGDFVGTHRDPFIHFYTFFFFTQSCTLLKTFYYEAWLEHSCSLARWVLRETQFA